MIDSFPKQLLGTGLSAPKDFDKLESIVKTALKNGIFGFDTAPSYGTEEMLSLALKQAMKEINVLRKDVFIQTKIDAWQMQKGPDEIKLFVEKALKNMNIDYFDSLLIHWPVPEYFDYTWNAFVDMRNENIVKHIGICNVRKRQLISFSSKDVFPEIVQIERNPLLTFSDEVEFCKQNKIAVQAYSPLCKMDKRISENDLLSKLSEKYKKSIGQVVLRWHIDTNTAPIFTSTKIERIEEYSKIYDFCLESNEISQINDLNIDYKMYLEAWACPGF